MFVPGSGKLSGVCIHKRYNITLILNELFNKTYNINSIYTMNL